MNLTEYIISHCEEKLSTNESPVWFLAIWSIFEAHAFLDEKVFTKNLINHAVVLDQRIINSKDELWPSMENEIRSIQNSFINLQTKANFTPIVFPADFQTNSTRENVDLLIAAIYQLRNKIAHGTLYPATEYNERSTFTYVNSMTQSSGLVCLKWIKMAS